MNKILTINCDGGARGNPGPAASAFIVQLGGKKIFEHGEYIGSTTNNLAEYSAVYFALLWAKAKTEEISYESILIKLDSQLVAQQLLGNYKVKDEDLKRVYQKIKDKEALIRKKVDYLFVRRGENKDADLLVNKTLDKLQ